MDDAIQHYLLVYNRLSGLLEDLREFGLDSAGALEAYAAAEEDFRDSEWMQVVLIGSDSLDTVRITHPNYFAPAGNRSKYFAGL